MLIDWITLINWIASGFIGLAFGVIGGYVTYRFERQRDDLQWEREKNKLQEQWKHEREQMDLSWQQKMQELKIQFMREDQIRLRDDILRVLDDPEKIIAASKFATNLREELNILHQMRVNNISVEDIELGLTLLQQLKEKKSLPEINSGITQPESKMQSNMPDFETVWKRIESQAGQEFEQIRGGKFTYEAASGYLKPDRTNRQISKSDFEEAYHLVPLENTTELQHLQGPSYIYAILMDKRIRETNW